MPGTSMGDCQQTGNRGIKATTQVNSAFFPTGVNKSTTPTWMRWVEHVHLCQETQWTTSLF